MHEFNPQAHHLFPQQRSHDYELPAAAHVPYSAPTADLSRQVLPISAESVFSPISPTPRTADPAETSARRTSCPEIMSSTTRTNGNGQHHNGNGASILPAPAAADTAAPKLAVVPQHVAIIMDGNGRWAKGRGMMRVAGHRSGVEAVRSCVRAAGEFGVKYLTLYAFSVENWLRPRPEIAALMLLLEQFLRDELEELMSNNVRLQAIGRLSDLPQSVRSRLDASIEATSGNTGLTLILALSYSGRVEIMEAVRSIAAEVRSGRLDPESITDTVLENHLYTSDYPDPDLLIRTSGEMRLSNFLLWQLSYTEIHVTPTLWPDFRRDQFVYALQDFASRQRRYGKV